MIVGPVLALLGACSTTEAPRFGPATDRPETAPALDAYTARSVGTDGDGPREQVTTVQVVALAGAEAAARAFATPLGGEIHALGAPPPGAVQVVVVSPATPPEALSRALNDPRAPTLPRHPRVVVLASGDADWAERASLAAAPHVAGVVDSAGELARWMTREEALQHEDVALWLALRAVTEAFGLPAPARVAVPDDAPALARILLGGARADDLLAANPVVRAEAVRVLGVTDGLLADPDPAVRLAVAAALGAADIASLANDPEPLVRARVADQSRDGAVLARLSRDPSSVVRVFATHTLARGELIADTNGEGAAALREAASHTDAYVRWKAASGLDDVELLVGLVRDVDLDVRRAAARRLGQVRVPAEQADAVRAALEAALGDTNSFVRRWAAEALGERGDARALPALVKVSSDPTGLVAFAARSARTRLGDAVPAAPWRPKPPPRDDEALAALLHDPDATVRKDAAKFAARGGDPTPLLTLQQDADSEVRKAAAEALGRMAQHAPKAQRDEVLAGLVAALSDTDPDTRITALDALASVGSVPEGARTRVRELSRARDTEERLRAVEALAADRSVPEAALRDALTDPDERVRAAAVARIPRALAKNEPSVLVRRAARAGTCTLDAAPTDPSREAWARGALSREDDLLHLRFSWNDPSERPRSHRTLRPPVLRPYGHPDRG